MADYNSYEEKQKKINSDSKASSSLIALAFFIIISIAFIAIIAIWCSFKSIYFYIKALKLRQESNKIYSFSKGFQDLRKTYSKYWDFVSDYFIKCCNSQGYYYYAIGILMYPIGLAFSLIFVLFHFVFIFIYVVFKTIFKSNKSEIEDNNDIEVYIKSQQQK